MGIPPEDEQYNPYLTPKHSGAPLPPVTAELPPAPCPRCGAEGARPVPYSAWHGRRAPRAIQEVRCPKCGVEFNGETGLAYPRRSSKLGWFLLALILFLLYMLASIAVG